MAQEELGVDALLTQRRIAVGRRGRREHHGPRLLAARCCRRSRRCCRPSARGRRRRRARSASRPSSGSVGPLARRQLRQHVLREHVLADRENRNPRVDAVPVTQRAAVAALLRDALVQRAADCSSPSSRATPRAPRRCPRAGRHDSGHHPTHAQSLTGRAVRPCTLAQIACQPRCPPPMQVNAICAITQNLAPVFIRGLHSAHEHRRSRLAHPADGTARTAASCGGGRSRLAQAARDGGGRYRGGARAARRTARRGRNEAPGARGEVRGGTPGARRKPCATSSTRSARPGSKEARRPTGRSSDRDSRRRGSRSRSPS